jgi:hypothetical protein
VEPLHLEEYRQLRATIRQRGSLRVVLVVATMAGWTVSACLVAALLPVPPASLLPLTLLVSGFEAVHVLHVGAERIGRYLYVRYESGIVPMMWESAIAAFGAGHRPSTRPAGGLFPLAFTFAILVNFLVTALGGTLAELAGIGALHALALVRVLTAHRAAAGQRADDQTRFEDVLK